MTESALKHGVADAQSVLEYFHSLEVDETWTFEEVTRAETSSLTHGYHRYPAKFIPQLASKLILQYSDKNDLVCDPFIGCGTTLVEAMVHKRRSVGVDINPAAYIASKAKTTPIKPAHLRTEIEQFHRRTERVLRYKETADLFGERIKPLIPDYRRIDYWFSANVKRELGLLLALIERVLDEDIRVFLRCAFSHILKNCSRWLMKSVKPTIDRGKVPTDVFDTFFTHVRRMAKGNEEFYNALPDDVRDNPKAFVRVELGDCRKLPVEDNSVRLIVTSSPYVTSYEYADLHQLTALWFGFAGTAERLRKGFIGTSLEKRVNISLNSEIANSTVRRFREIRHAKLAQEVHTYFAEMQQAFEEFRRVLTPEGIACFVIGDTALKGVEIPNAEVFLETCTRLGFLPVRVIKRRIPGTGKILPSVRDQATGRFTSVNDENSVEAYPHEYIVIVRK